MLPTRAVPFPNARFQWGSYALWVLLFVWSGWGCGGECKYDADCPDAAICRQGICTSNLVGDLCQGDVDCQSGQRCIKQKCVSPECSDGITQPCFDGPATSQGVGLCQAGVKTCQNGAWGPCTGQILPSTELCDQLDNDCNGQTDDSPDCQSGCTAGQTRPCYTGPPAARGIGVCRAGNQSCQSGAWGPCLGQVLPASSENCNDGLDNNCNGQTDEGCGPCQAGQTRPCYTGAANTRDVGACKSGKEICQNGQWTACNGEVKPSPEACDQKDNDCNGKIDDSPNCQSGCTAGQTRACYTGPAGTKGTGECKEGTQSCQNGAWGTCTGQVLPSSEQCGDQKDNNCNGQTDEGCGVCKDGAQEVCYSGQQGCSKNPDGSYSCNTPCSSGTRSCQSGQWTNCVGEKLPFPREVCNNNVDDDCNGQIDDNCGNCVNGQTQACYTGPAGTQGIGECKAGAQTCTGGQWGACLGEIKPTNEQCGDQKDNNCNGQADENCSTKLHKNCSANGDCDPGQICLSAGSQGYCFQDCTSASGACSSNSDGRTQCMAVATDASGQSISICVKQAAPGAACTPIQSIMCQSGYACLGGVCKQVQISQEGGVCDGQASPPKLCATGTTCVGFGTGYDAICLKGCDSSNASSCGAGYRCIALQAGGGACIQIGCTASSQCRYPNHQCVPDSQLQTNICAPKPQTGPIGFAGVCNPNVASQRCQSGLFCLRVQGATTGHCSMICSGSGRANCPSTSQGLVQCLLINTTQRACVITCSASCPLGLRCQNIGGSNFCFP